MEPDTAAIEVSSIESRLLAGENYASFDPAETSAPLVDENDMTALFVATYDNVYDYMTAACDDTYSRKSGALTLLTIGATGTSTTTRHVEAS